MALLGRYSGPPGAARPVQGPALGVVALLTCAAPLGAQEVPGTTGEAPATAADATLAAVGPRGAPIGGGSLADPSEPYAPGSAVRLGAFGAPFGGPSPPAEPTGRAWNVVPGIAAMVGATNNVYQTHDNARSDAFFLITPSILVEGASARIRATLNYAPTAQLYATYTDQNTVTQFGNGQILAELLPGALYLDIRGSASLGTTGGGFVPGTAQTARRSDQVQYYNLEIAPYFVHQFGSAATAQVGYVFQYSSQQGTSGFQPSATEPFFSDQDYTANRGYAVLRTGEDFGRLALQGRVDGTQFSGSGVYDDAHVFFATVEARYAITPGIAVLLEGGYENISYGGTEAARIDDAVWNVGLRLTPTRESFLVLRYGHRAGFDSPSVEAGIQLGAFTRLTASYSERLATNAMLTQDLLSTTTLDALGNPVDSQSGAPVLYANSFFPASNGLYRNRLGSVGLTFSWPRDSVTLSAYYLKQEPVSAAQGTQITESTGYYGGIAWTHEITTSTAITMQVQLGKTDYLDSPSSNVLLVGAAVSHQLTERLRATVQAFYNSRTSSEQANEYSQATVMAGLSWAF